MTSLELEKTYLLKYLPPDLEKYPHKEVFDIYIPATAPHPVLRIRKNGEVFEMTKKQPSESGDASEQLEHTIKLTADEFKALSEIKGKKVRKIRYNYPYGDLTAEIAVFQDDLAGLVMVDFEFSSKKIKDAFKMPEFCLVDVTDDDTFAGGMLCGKRYEGIEGQLKLLKYQPIFIGPK